MGPISFVAHTDLKIRNSLRCSWAWEEIMKLRYYGYTELRIEKFDYKRISFRKFKKN